MKKTFTKKLVLIDIEEWEKAKCYWDKEQKNLLRKFLKL